MKTWIFQGNPEVFDIDSYLAATAGLITWRVARYADTVQSNAAGFSCWVAGAVRGAGLNQWMQILRATLNN
jgi:hypothetical protein